DFYPIRDAFSTIGTAHSWSALFGGADRVRGLARYRELACKIQRCGEFTNCTQPFQDAIALLAAPPEALQPTELAASMKVVKTELCDQFEKNGYSLSWCRKQDGQAKQDSSSQAESGSEFGTVALELVALPAYEYILYARGQMKRLLFFFSGSFVLIG